MQTIRTAIILLLAGNLLSGALFAQAVGVGTATPNASAMLEVNSSNKGLLVPRVSLASLTDAATIVNPANSLLVYNTNSSISGGAGYYYNSGTPAAPVWVKMLTSTAAGWGLTGNGGTNPSTHFIGTTDYVPLRFRMNNVNSGFIDAATRTTMFGFQAGQNHTFVSNSSSTGFGYEVLSGNVGYANVAIGTSAMASNQQFGYYNTALGFETLYSNTTGQRNVAVGNTAMHDNTTGGNNVAIGDSTMAANLNGTNNTAVGANALRRSNSAGSNTAIGLNALENATGGSNTAVGVSSMRNSGTGTQNTAVGQSSLLTNNSGTRNVAMGYQAMDGNVSGSYNTGIGASSLGSQTNGSYNTAVGYQAMSAGISGSYNTALGHAALANNRGDNNTAIGYNALHDNLSAWYNIAIGKSALADMTFLNDGLGYAAYNVAVGIESLMNNNPTAATNLQATNGIKNVGVGSFSLKENTNGYGNTAIGHQSMTSTTTGHYNCAIGIESMYFNTSGDFNTAAGPQSLRLNTSGAYNTAIGFLALNGNTSGDNNTAIGYTAGSFNNANTNCTFLGFDANQSTGTNFDNSTALGRNSRITASNQVRIGNTVVSSIGGYAAWSNLSDGRFKRNISEAVKGLEFIMALRPVTYNIDVNGLAVYLKEDVYKNAEGIEVTRTADAATRQQRSQLGLVTQSGFIAQEVEAAAKKVGYDFSGVDKPKNGADLYALRYSEFVVPLVKAVQEQQLEINALKARLERLEQLIAGGSGK